MGRACRPGETSKAKENRELQKVLEQRREQVSEVSQGASVSLEGSGAKRIKLTSHQPNDLHASYSSPLLGQMYDAKVMRASANCRDMPCFIIVVTVIVLIFTMIIIFCDSGSRSSCHCQLIKKCWFLSCKGKVHR